MIVTHPSGHSSLNAKLTSRHCGMIQTWGSHPQGVITRFLFNVVSLSGPGPLLPFCAEWASCSYSMEDGEKEGTAKEEEQADALWAEVTKKKKRRRGQKVEKPEAFMANFFKGLEIYQTKLLVSTPAWPCSRCRPQMSGHWCCFTVCFVMLPCLSHSFSSLIHLLFPFVLEEKEKRLAWGKPSAPALLPSTGCPVLSASELSCVMCSLSLS